MGVATTVAVIGLIAALVVFYTWRLASERDRAQMEEAKATKVAEFLTGLFEVSDPSQSKGETITIYSSKTVVALSPLKSIAGRDEAFISIPILAIHQRRWMVSSLTSPYKATFPGGYPHRDEDLLEKIRDMFFTPTPVSSGGANNTISIDFKTAQLRIGHSPEAMLIAWLKNPHREGTLCICF